MVNVRVCIYELPMEYFYEPIVEFIASALGPVVNIDEHTQNRTICHYVRVLIELNL